MKRILFSALILLFAVGSISAQKQKKASKKENKAKVETKAEEAAKPDTVGVDLFSYCLGAANSNGLKMYLARQMGVDTTKYMNDFILGFIAMSNDPTNEKLKSYAAGVNVADQVVNQIIPQSNKQITDSADSAFINKEEFIRGFVEAIRGQNQNLPVDSATAITNRQMQYYHDQLMEKKYGDNRRAGEAFLAENAKKDSVVTLPSGLQYKIIKQGTGETPQATSRVEVNYEGRLIDGTVFDSSYKRKKSQEFNVNGVVPGFSEALQLMPVGSTWEIYVPQELAYGSVERRNSPIKPFSALIFKIDLVSIKAAPKPKVATPKN